LASLSEILKKSYCFFHSYHLNKPFTAVCLGNDFKFLPLVYQNTKCIASNQSISHLYKVIINKSFVFHLRQCGRPLLYSGYVFDKSAKFYHHHISPIFKFQFLSFVLNYIIPLFLICKSWAWKLDIYSLLIYVNT
jgi:hypothetical protein